MWALKIFMILGPTFRAPVLSGGREFMAGLISCAGETRRDYVDFNRDGLDCGDRKGVTGGESTPVETRD